MKQRAYPPKRRRNQISSATASSSRLPVVLTAVHPRAQCSVFAEEQGTFCITATLDMKPDINSLSTVEPYCGEWNEVPIFRQDKTETQRLGLKQHLQQLVDDSTPTSIPDFLLQSERIFQELISLTKECEASDANKNESSPSSPWTVDYADQLTKQLEEVERVHGSKAIQSLSDDLLKLTLQYQDDAQRLHIVILNLSPDSFPQTAPKCQTNLPAKWQPHWKPNPLDGDQSARPHKRFKVDPNSNNNESASEGNGEHCGLVQLYSDFVSQVDKYQALWNELDHLDDNTLVLEPSTRPPCQSNSERRIAVTEGTSVAVVLDPKCPRAKPKSVRWIGADTSHLRGRFNNYIAGADQGAGWSMNISVKENLQRGLGIELPTRSPTEEKPAEESTTLECSICYNHDLPTEEGRSEFPEAVCDNGPCNRHYHETCLYEWLQSLPSSRKSFDRIIGTCPYCNEPISAKLLHNK